VLAVRVAVQPDEAGVHPPVSLRRVLRLRPTSRTGGAQHRLDRRVRVAAPSHSHQQLHPHLLGRRRFSTWVMEALQGGADDPPTILIGSATVHLAHATPDYQCSLCYGPRAWGASRHPMKNSSQGISTFGIGKPSFSKA